MVEKKAIAAHHVELFQVVSGGFKENRSIYKSAPNLANKIPVSDMPFLLSPRSRSKDKFCDCKIQPFRSEEQKTAPSPISTIQKKEKKPGAGWLSPLLFSILGAMQRAALGIKKEGSLTFAEHVIADAEAVDLMSSDDP